VRRHIYAFVQAQRQRNQFVLTEGSMPSPRRKLSKISVTITFALHRGTAFSVHILSYTSLSAYTVYTYGYHTSMLVVSSLPHVPESDHYSTTARARTSSCAQCSFSVHVLKSCALAMSVRGYENVTHAHCFSHGLPRAFGAHGCSD
jgi:hypothetical protein